VEHEEDTATLELLVLAGGVEVEGEPLRVGGFLTLPQDQAAPAVRSAAGALVVAYWNPDMPAFGPPMTRPRAVATWAEPWVADVPGSHGLFHKKLRLPDISGDWNASETYDGGPGGYLRLVLITPGADPRQHVHHECWEELIVLRGDLYMPERGHFGAGSYVANPQEYWHAPFASQGGALCIVHTDGPMGIPFDFREYPLGQELVDGYLEGRPLLDDPRHVPWETLPDAPRWEAHEPAREWRAVDGPMWAADGDRDRAAIFRSQWGGRRTAVTARPGRES
jgi:hypothetical protein